MEGQQRRDEPFRPEGTTAGPSGKVLGQSSSPLGFHPRSSYFPYVEADHRCPLRDSSIGTPATNVFEEFDVEVQPVASRPIEPIEPTAETRGGSSHLRTWVELQIACANRSNRR